MRHAATRIIADEHRSLRAVLGALQRFARDLVEGRLVDPALAEDIFRYIDEFPRRVHHPKEDAFLFARLRERSGEVERVIDELERDHAEEETLLREMRDRFADVTRLGAPPSTFACLVDEYAGFLLRHMMLEESLVVRLSEERLSQDDWAQIDAAFLANDDPLSRSLPSAEFRELYRSITRAASAARH